MTGKGKNYGLVRAASILAVLALFAVSGMVLVNVGVIVYRNIVESNLENYELRTSLSYVRTKVEQADEKGCAVITDLDGNKGLVLTETDDTGEKIDTVIYYYKGNMCELTHDHGASFKPGDGFQIVSVDDFQIAESKKGLIKLTAGDSNGSSESMYIAVRSELGD